MTRLVVRKGQAGRSPCTDTAVADCNAVQDCKQTYFSGTLIQSLVTLVHKAISLLHDDLYSANTNTLQWRTGLVI